MKIGKGDVAYILILSLIISISTGILYYYKTGFFAEKPLLFVFYGKNCSSCQEFIEYAKEKLGRMGYSIIVYSIDANATGKRLFEEITSMGIPSIMPLSIVTVSDEVKAIVLGAFQGDKLWLFIKEDLSGLKNIVPVYSHGEPVGFVKSDDCMRKTFYKELYTGTPGMISSQCGGLEKYSYVYTGAPPHKIFNPP